MTLNQSNEKLIHRMEQRGYSFDENEEDETAKKVEVEIPSPIEELSSHENWASVELQLDDLDLGAYTREEINYFIEDHEERFPPPKVNRIDAIASVIYEEEESLLLVGLLRNGFSDESFKQERLEGSTLRLVDANLSRWAETSFSAELARDVLEPNQVVPFRQSIPIEDIHHPEFDFDSFHYFLSFHLKPEEEDDDEEEDEDEDEDD